MAINKRSTESPSHSAAGEEPRGRFNYGGLERVIHEKARLGILASLAAHPNGLLFGDLKSLCELTDGNLSRHIQILQEAELVQVWKGFRRNRPQTLCRLTDAGKRRFLEYVEELERVISDAQVVSQSRAAPRPIPDGFSPI